MNGRRDLKENIASHLEVGVNNMNKKDALMLIDKHIEREGYNSKEPWKWGVEGYSGFSCICGCELTLKDLQKK